MEGPVWPPVAASTFGQYDETMNLGFSEMLFIFFLALLLFGPKKLPEIGRQIGRALNEFKRASNEFKWQLESEMRNLDSEAKGGTPNAAENSIFSSLGKAMAEFRGARDEFKNQMDRELRALDAKDTHEDVAQPLPPPDTIAKGATAAAAPEPATPVVGEVIPPVKGTDA